MKNQSEIGTPVAVAPPIARSTKPDAIATMSNTATCFNHTEYKVVIATYAATVTASCHRVVNDSPMPATTRTTPAIRAVVTLKAPEATGRRRLRG